MKKSILFVWVLIGAFNCTLPNHKRADIGSKNDDEKIRRDTQMPKPEVQVMWLDNDETYGKDPDFHWIIYTTNRKMTEAQKRFFHSVKYCDTCTLCDEHELDPYSTKEGVYMCKKIETSFVSVNIDKTLAVLSHDNHQGHFIGATALVYKKNKKYIKIDELETGLLVAYRREKGNLFLLIKHYHTLEHSVATIIYKIDKRRKKFVMEDVYSYEDKRITNDSLKRVVFKKVKKAYRK